MRDYARKAVAMTSGRSRQDLDQEEMLRLALTHLVELVGEAASQVPTDEQLANPAIPWPKVIGLQHRLIHGYDLVDYDILWDTIRHDLPDLIKELDRILGPET
jgi:uncharacterized protein with HEPN domain